MTTKTCRAPECSHQGRPQPIEEFRRDRSRKLCRTCVRARDLARYHRARVTGQPVDAEPGGRLALEPLHHWVKARLDEIAIHSDEPAWLLSTCLGVSDHALARWLKGPDGTVLLDTVDRAFCNWGDPGLLRELYPEVYDLPPYVEPPEPTDLTTPQARLRWLKGLQAAGIKRQEMINRYAAETGIQLTPLKLANLLRCRAEHSYLQTRTIAVLMGTHDGISQPGLTHSQAA